MVDFSFIGKEGLIVQYDDIIAMVGYNVARYLKSKEYNNDKLRKMSTQDILLSYINRPNEDPSIWLREEFDIEFTVDKYKNSFVTWQPNWWYFYKVFKAAKDNGIKQLYVYTEKYIPIIESDYIKTFGVPIKYITGDIKQILSEHVNYTFMTASPSNILKCLDIEVPIAITIFDDFLCLADVVCDGIADKLREKTKFVNFSGVASAGLI